MSKFKKKFAKQIIAYVLAGAMIMSNMASPNGTVFASEADTEDKYQIEEVSEVIEEASGEEELIVEKDEKEDDVNEPESTPTGDESGSSTSTESTPAGNEPASSTPTESEPASSTPEGSSESNEGSSTPDDEQADADGFYDGFKVATAAAEKSYYFDFVKAYSSAGTQISEKGLFSVDQATGNAPAYHSDAHGVNFKVGNKLTFKVSGDSYIVIGGNNNNSTNFVATCSDANGSFYRTNEPSQTAGVATEAECKNMTKNVVVFEYTGGTGTVTLTCTGGSDAYIKNACIIPLKADDKTATKWTFENDSVFAKIDQANSTAFKFRGLVCSGAKNNQNKYLLADANSKITVPVKDTENAGKVIVKACYDYAFSFGNGEKIARKSGATNQIDAYEYYYEAGTREVVINVKAGSYFNSIEIAADTAIADTEEWIFGEGGVDPDNSDTYNGLTIAGGVKHSDGSLRSGNGLITVPVKGKCTITVTTNFNWEIGFFNLDKKYSHTTSSTPTIDYTYEGGKGIVPIIIGDGKTETDTTGFTTYIKKIAVTYNENPDIEYVAEGIINFVYPNNEGSKLTDALTKTKGLVCTEFGFNVDSAGTEKSDHGATTQSANAKMVLNLEKKADIRIVGCQYANTKTITAKSGEKTTVLQPSAAVDPLYELKDVEAGELTLTFEHKMYIHSIEVTYKEELSSDKIAFVFDPVEEGIATLEDIASGSKYFNDYFEVVGGNISGKNSTTVRLGNNATGAIQFKTRGKSVIEIKARSTGGSNKSNIVLYKVSSSGKEIIDEIKEIEGNTISTLTYENLEPGTYMVAVPTEDHPHSRGVDVAKISVTEEVTPVEVTVNVTATEINEELGLVFTCDQTKQEITQKVEEGKCIVTLNDKYSYSLMASPTKFVIKEGNSLTVDKAQPTHNVTVEQVSLKSVTGAIKGLDDDADAKEKVVIKFQKPDDKIYTPEITIDRTAMTYSVELETGVTYTIVTEGINDYELDASVSGNGATITVTESDTTVTRDLTYTKKPTHTVTIEPEGAELSDLSVAVFTFTNIEEEGYVYPFTGPENIKLRDGVYDVKVSNSGEFIQKLTSNLVVKGEDVVKKIGFDSNIKTWIFSAAEGFTKEVCDAGNYKGLLLTGVSAESGKAHAVMKPTDDPETNGKIRIPVKESCDIAVTCYYAATGTLGDVDFALVPDDGYYGSTGSAKTITYSYTYTGNGEKEYVELTAKKPNPDLVDSKGNALNASTFITKIEIIVTEPFADKVTVNPAAAEENNNYKTINDALNAVRKMDRTNDDGSIKRVTIEIQPGDYEEMLVVDIPNITLKNANENPSITPINKGVNIDKSSVRITSYYGVGYDYYSMDSNYQWNEEVLNVNKENGSATTTNPTNGGTGSMWNATVIIRESGFEADGIIFENSFNQYVSKKAAQDTIVPQGGAKGEKLGARNDLPVGSTQVQYKDYVERAAALAIANECKQISFNNCSFISRQDTLYGGTGTTAAFYGCDIYGSTDYIMGPMTAVFAKCGLLFNTNDETETGLKNDVGHITAAQQAAGRGYLMYNCIVTTTTPGVNTASKSFTNAGTFGRPWSANGEAVFYKTVVGTTFAKGDDNTTISDKVVSLIQPDGWNNGLTQSGSIYSQEYGTIELAKDIDNSTKRVQWAKVLTADSDGNITLADGNTKVNDSNVVAAFLGDWKPFAGKDMTISEENNRVDPINPDNPDDPNNPNITVDETAGIEIVGLLDKYDFTGAAITPDFDVVDNSIKQNGTPRVLVLGTDYTVKYKDNKKEGATATVTVVGKGNYAGKEVTGTFKVESTLKVTDEAVLIDVKGAKITKIAPRPYTGEAQYPEIELTPKGGSAVKYTYDTDKKQYLKADKTADINVTISGNKNKGTATILVTGKKDAKSGKATSTKATFKITPIDLSKAGDKIKVNFVGEETGKEFTAPYAVKGATPKVTVTYTFAGENGAPDRTVTLKAGKDYTVKYSANKKADATGKVVITGKGNYTKKAPEKTFKVEKLDMKDTTLVAVEAYEGAKAAKLKAVVVDTNGDALKASQYTVNVYADKEGKTAYTGDDKGKCKLGDTIYVQAVAKDVKNLVADSKTPELLEVKVGANIAKMKIKVNVKSKAYTGTYVKLAESDLTITTKEGAMVNLKPAEDKDMKENECYYEIVSYSNNINKGTATAVIRGCGACSGTKTIKFKIAAKEMKKHTAAQTPTN